MPAGLREFDTPMSAVLALGWRRLPFLWCHPGLWDPRFGINYLHSSASAVCNSQMPVFLSFTGRCSPNWTPCSIVTRMIFDSGAVQKRSPTLTKRDFDAWYLPHHFLLLNIIIVSSLCCAGIPQGVNLRETLHGKMIYFPFRLFPFEH